MASADFCGLPPCITAGRAVWSDGSGPVRSLEIGLLDLAPGRIRYGTTRPFLPSAPHRHGAQISPSRCANCRCTSAALTVGLQGAYRWVLLPPATCHLPSAICHLPSPTASLGLDYAVSCGLQSVASHLLHSGFVHTNPRGLALAFGSWLALLTLSPSLYSHRGLAPHQFAPMLGAHA